METPLIYSKITAVMRDMDAISKSSTNAQQGFKYRSIDAFMNATNAAFAKHGVFVTPKVLSSQRDERLTKSGGNMFYTIQRIEYTFYASDGSNISATVDGEAMDSGDKGSNKCLAVALKYALAQTLMIPFEDMKKDDTDATTPEPSVKKPESKVAEFKSGLQPIPEKALPPLEAPSLTTTEKTPDKIYIETALNMVGLPNINIAALSVAMDEFKTLKAVHALSAVQLKVLTAVLKEKGMLTEKIINSAKLTAYGK